MSEAVAVIGSNALVLDTETAEELELEIGMVAASAEQLSVKDEETAGKAAELKKRISKLKKRVTDAWEPHRVKAKEGYDAVLEGKKTMLAPVEKAEKTVAKELNDYAYQLEQQRRAEEEARRKLLEEAMVAKLEEAAKAESSGDSSGAETAMAEAEVYDSMAVPAAPAPEKLNDAMKQKVGWEIMDIDVKAVPLCIRTTDGRYIRVQLGNKAVVEALVKQAIEAEQGSISIPGVAFRETMKVSVR